jgi:molybdate transport system regulatory protein
MSLAKPFVCIDLANGLRIEPLSIALLKAIQIAGSISGAARSIRKSYRWAWVVVDEMNQCIQGPVVVSSSGGHHGGQAIVTAVGVRIIDLFQAVESQSRAAIEQELQAFAGLASAERGPNKKTSAEALLVRPDPEW